MPHMRLEYMDGGDLQGLIEQGRREVLQGMICLNLKSKRL